jgi:hypothetical protein
MKVSAKDGVTELSPDHPEASSAHIRLLEALGSNDSDFLNGLLKQLCNVGSTGRSVDEDGLNFMLAMVKGIEPRDQVETMLAAQMAAVHNATMTFARRLNHVENIPQQDSAERAFNKLRRVSQAQFPLLPLLCAFPKSAADCGQPGVMLLWLRVRRCDRDTAEWLGCPGRSMLAKRLCSHDAPVRRRHRWRTR